MRDVSNFWFWEMPCVFTLHLHAIWRHIGKLLSCLRKMVLYTWSTKNSVQQNTNFIKLYPFGENNRLESFCNIHNWFVAQTSVQIMELHLRRESLSEKLNGATRTPPCAGTPSERFLVCFSVHFTVGPCSTFFVRSKATHRFSVS